VKVTWSEVVSRLEDEGGWSLVESLVAVAILGTAVTAFILALSAGSIAVRDNDELLVAQKLVQSQLEYIKSQPYDLTGANYTSIEVPQSYSLSTEVGSVPGTDSDIQKITVIISHDGEELMSVEDYKVDR